MEAHDEGLGMPQQGIDTSHEGFLKDPPGSTATVAADAAPATDGEPKTAEPDPVAMASQGQFEQQSVPEQRPQAFMTPTGGVSESSKRLDGGDPATQEEVDRANSDEAKQASVKNSRTPRLLVGQRVMFSKGPEQGRMAYVDKVVYANALSEMLAAVGVPESRFAEVEEYIVKTRDGRSDTLVAKPDEIQPLDDIEGWGRGRI